MSWRIELASLPRRQDAYFAAEAQERRDRARMGRLGTCRCRRYLLGFNDRAPASSAESVRDRDGLHTRARCPPRRKR